MELIFDSFEEQKKFIKTNCPRMCNGKNDLNCRAPYRYEGCKKCWEQSGVKYRVKPQVTLEIHHPSGYQFDIIDNQPTPDNPIPIRMQKGSTVTLVCDEYLKPGDKIVCEDGVWGVERQTDEEYHHWLMKKAQEYLKETPVEPFVIRTTSLWTDHAEAIAVTFKEDGAKKEPEKPTPEDRVTAAIKELESAIAELFGVPESVLTGEKKEPSPLDKINERNKTRACVDCKSYEKDTVEEPCCRCDAIEHDKFEKKVVDHCKNCQYRPVSPWHIPCKGCIYSCGTEDRFKPVEKKCTNCKHLKVKHFDDPCCLCRSYSNFEAADK